mmetsp:Transcript_8925/g.16522  ORF Transcript_8925/g.16522 Transcript_8925/m.16522 type:complete len:87 (+) Transcript_8925:91-351(+)
MATRRSLPPGQQVRLVVIRAAPRRLRPDRRERDLSIVWRVETWMAGAAILQSSLIASRLHAILAVHQGASFDVTELKDQGGHTRDA